MKKTTNFFGKTDDFRPGDLVFWSDLAKKRRLLPSKKVGVVSEVFLKHVGGRDIALARVYCLKDEKKYEIPLITLKRIDENKTIYSKEGKKDGICYN